MKHNEFRVKKTYPNDLLEKFTKNRSNPKSTTQNMMKIANPQIIVLLYSEQL